MTYLPMQKEEKMELRRSGVVILPVSDDNALVASRMSMAMKSGDIPEEIWEMARRRASPALRRSP